MRMTGIDMIVSQLMCLLGDGISNPGLAIADIDAIKTGKGINHFLALAVTNADA